MKISTVLQFNQPSLWLACSGLSCCISETFNIHCPICLNSYVVAINSNFIELKKKFTYNQHSLFRGSSFKTAVTNNINGHQISCAVVLQKTTGKVPDQFV